MVPLNKTVSAISFQVEVLFCASLFLIQIQVTPSMKLSLMFQLT